MENPPVWMRVSVIALVLLTAASVGAQAPSPPTLTESQRLQLQILELRAENAQLKIALQQVELAKVQSEFASLQRDGYTLRRGDDGVWQYHDATKAPAK